MLTKASHPTFVFNENNVHSNKKTVYEANKGDNRDTDNYNNNEINEDGFMEWQSKKFLRIFRQSHCNQNVVLVGMDF